VAILVTACWLPTAQADIWADNQTSRGLVVTLSFDGGDVTYAYAVPPLSRGILLQGSGAVPDQVKVTDATGADLGAFKPRCAQVGVIVGPSWELSVRDCEAIPFDRATEFELLPAD
jgi:hypothetical protein